MVEIQRLLNMVSIVAELAFKVPRLIARLVNDVQIFSAGRLVNDVQTFSKRSAKLQTIRKATADKAATTFPQSLWKSLWKTCLLALQVSEKFRLLAFCTRARQNIANFFQVARRP
jgi:hypothetical protein